MAQATAAVNQSWSDRLGERLDQMVNEQFESPEYKRFFDCPLTIERARFEATQIRYFALNRRDCWGYVQGKAPFAVKKVIWAHEKDELIADARAGIDHIELVSREAMVLGVTAQELATIQPIPDARAAFLGWIHLSETLPWLGGITVAHVLERRNNSALIKGGGASERWRRKLVTELDLPAEKLINSNVHVEADQGHSDDLWECIRSYVVDAASYGAALYGAEQSLVLDRAYRGAVAYAMMEI